MMATLSLEAPPARLSFLDHYLTVWISWPATTAMLTSTDSGYRAGYTFSNPLVSR